MGHYLYDPKHVHKLPSPKQKKRAGQDDKTHVYMCGLKGMESGMAECFGPIAEKNGIVWTEFAKAMKKAWPCRAPWGIFMPCAFNI